MFLGTARESQSSGVENNKDIQCMSRGIWKRLSCRIAPRLTNSTYIQTSLINSCRKKVYHSFQNDYTHEIVIFELFRGLQFQFSGVFRIN